MIEEDVLPRELTSPIARRGKWTAEEERYTEKIICKSVHLELVQIRLFVWVKSDFSSS